MNYDKINYEEGKHLSLIVSTARKIGYDHLNAIKEYTSSEYHFQDKINQINGKYSGIISNEAKKQAFEETMNKLLKMHVK